MQESSIRIGAEEVTPATRRSTQAMQVAFDLMMQPWTRHSEYDGVGNYIGPGCSDDPESTSWMSGELKPDVAWGGYDA